MTKKQNSEHSLEIGAIGAVHKALEGLSSEAQARVLSYVANMLKLEVPVAQGDQASYQGSFKHPSDTIPSPAATPSQAGTEEGFEGISPVAKKWMARNGLQAQALATIFSLGGDEIDLIAKTIPGKGNKDRMHSVLLLMGIAAYLGSGAARFTHEQLKEACLHYKAYDSANFASYLKSFSAEVTGDKNTAYVLTPRGMSNATDMVKQITGSEKAPHEN